MIHIVGGTYFETCAEPYWDQLYGSGLRAAAAISALGEHPKLTTYVSDDAAKTLEIVGETFQIEAIGTPVPQTPSFNYRHPLEVPHIVPSQRNFQSQSPRCSGREGLEVWTFGGRRNHKG